MWTGKKSARHVEKLQATFITEPILRNLWEGSTASEYSGDSDCWHNSIIQC